MNPEEKNRQKNLYLLQYSLSSDNDYTYEIFNHSADASERAKEINEKNPKIKIKMFDVEPVTLEKGWRKAEYYYYNRKYFIIIESEKLTKKYIVNNLEEASERIKNFSNKIKKIKAYRENDEYEWSYVHAY